MKRRRVLVNELCDEADKKSKVITRSKSKGQNSAQENRAFSDAASLPQSESKGCVGIGGCPGMRKAGCIGLTKLCMYYDPLSGPSLTPICQNELLYFTQLAIWSYNIKEMLSIALFILIYLYCILFSNHYIYIHEDRPQTMAKSKSSWQKDGWLCILIIISLLKPSLLMGLPQHSKQKYSILYLDHVQRLRLSLYVRITPSDTESDHFGQISYVHPSIREEDHPSNLEEDHPSNLVHKDKIYKQRLSQLIKTHRDDYQFKLPIYLSQFALVSYNILQLHVDAAMHDIPSLKLVKPMKRVRKAATYLFTFQASLCDDSKNVETFETEICMPTIYPTTKIEFWTSRIESNW